MKVFLSWCTDFDTKMLIFRQESMNESKVYFEKAWPPIIHASALWLHAEGFENVAKEVEDINTGI